MRTNPRINPMIRAIARKTQLTTTFCVPKPKMKYNNHFRNSKVSKRHMDPMLILKQFLAKNKSQKTDDYTHNLAIKGGGGGNQKGFFPF